MDDRPPEAVETGDVRAHQLVEHADGADEHSSPVQLAVRVVDLPLLLILAAQSMEIGADYVNLETPEGPSS